MADLIPPRWEDELGRMPGPRDGPVTCRLVTAAPEPADPVAGELRILAADLLELHEAGALAGIRAVVSERLRQVRGEPSAGIDGRAFQAAMLAEEIDRGA